MALGHLPAVFALPAGLGDIVIGIEAAVITRRLQRGVVGRRVVWFNVLGLRDLVDAGESLDDLSSTSASTSHPPNSPAAVIRASPRSDLRWTRNSPTCSD
jgi:hypothetical protein